MTLACKPNADAAGGDADEEQHSKLLENLTREQTKLGNMKPGQRFSLGDANKNIGVKAFLPTAGATKIYMQLSLILRQVLRKSKAISRAHNCRQHAMILDSNTKLCGSAADDDDDDDDDIFDSEFPVEDLDKEAPASFEGSPKRPIAGELPSPACLHASRWSIQALTPED